MRSGQVLRAFLICDIRGYSTFASQRGDEATSRLAQRFQSIATEVLAEHAGEIVNRRGDEVVAAFESPRQAVRAAVAFQRALLSATKDDPSFPLPAGIGMDFGEAVIADGEWSANAINVAARLCSIAVAGEVLATQELRHIAQAVDGSSYQQLQPVSLKGITRPVQRVRVVDTELDTAAELRRLGLTQAAVAPTPRRAMRRRDLVAAATALVVAVAASAVAIVRTDSTPVPRVPVDALAALSLGGGSEHATVGLGGSPGSIAADGGAAWVLNTAASTVTRVDAADPTASADVVQVGNDPSAIAIGYGATWVTNSNDKSVSRINAGTPPDVGDTITVGNDPSAVVAGFNRVWVANQIDDTVSVIDPVASIGSPADRVVATIPVGGEPDGLAVGFGSIWVANAGSSTVSRIDPKQMIATDSISVGNGPAGIAANAEGVWVANALDGTVSHVAPTTDSVTATIAVASHPNAIAVNSQHVWIADANAITDVNPSTEEVERSEPEPNGVRGIAIGDGQLWVDAGATTRDHRGGTLSVVQSTDAANTGDATTFDPGTAYSQFAWSVLATTNDGLIAFQHTGGAAGALLVPDLAETLPQVSADGLTYTAHLRTGVRYSTGAPVRASDFRASLERMFRLGQAPPYYNDIVGGAECASRPLHCSLARGIVTDDSTGSIVIHLATADRDLDSVLALPFADLLPADTPTRDLGFGPHPSTGPYVITRHSGDSTLLGRNPYFREWSAAAQPVGYPDHVTITTRRSGAQTNVAAVARGQFDWTPDGVTGDQLSDLVRTRTSQLHPDTENSVRYLFLNTTMAPFRDPRARQAVNFAIDRRAAAAALGGPLEASVTCQLIPPSLFGYHPYCPYTGSATSSGIWSGTDLKRARELIRQSHVAGSKVTVVIPADYAALAPILVGAMRSIGLDAKARIYPASPDGSDASYYNYIGTAANHVQAALEGWFVDYPEPSNLIGELLECSDRTPTGNLDESMFCDPTVDLEITSALEEQEADPATAGLAWASIDQTIDNLAPWVPLINDREYHVVSQRVQNYQHNPEYGMLIDQAWLN